VKSGGAPATFSSKFKMKFAAAGGALLCCLSIVVCFLVPGCKRERLAKLTPVEVHQITRELAKAASDVTPKDTVVKSRRSRSGSAGGGTDELYIGLRQNAAMIDKVRQAIEGVATRHRLTVDPASPNGNTTQLTLRSGGFLTHHIEIEVQGPRVAESGEIRGAGQAKLAILLDDLGSDRRAADAIFRLRIPITLSVLPYHAHSQEIAREAKKRGCEVMLHLPMQSVANETPEGRELRPGLPRGEVEDLVTKMLEAVPEADGVNNHQGSQATSNTALMDELMPVLRDAGVFYVDSRTTPATVAYDTAKRNGVKTAFRNVPFLDDVQNKAAVKRQLQIAIRGAKEKGEAIAIGHPHTVTLEALREILPETKKQGVEFVFVSDLVH
jgi:polysaccharide deacetylase 2 family uncharacterized protein YibQ